MINLIWGEWKKLVKQKIILMIMVTLLLLTMGCGVYKKMMNEDSIQGDWKQSLISKNQLLEKQINEAPPGSLTSTYNQKQILINEYRIKEDIKPVQKDNVWSFAYFCKLILSFVGLIVITIASRLVSSEYHWNTIQTLLTKPIPKWKLITSKIFTLLSFSFLVVFLQLIIGLVVGVVIFGTQGNQIMLEVQHGTVVEESYLWVLLRYYLLDFISLFVISMIGFTLSTIFRNTIIAMAISLFLYFTSGNFTRLIAPYFEEIKYFLFANTDLNMYFNGTPLIDGMTLTFSTTVLGVYLVILLSISIFIFVKREV